MTPDGAETVGSVRTLLDIIEKIEPTRDEALFYRGHTDYEHQLVPSIYRDRSLIENEDILFKEMVLRCPNDFDAADNTFQMLVKMQHYSLPTRLLDITANPLIALYFACLEADNGPDFGEVVVFKVPKRQIKYNDSDTVSVISNLARRPSSFQIPQLTDIDDFNDETQIQYLLHEIQREKPYFKPRIDKRHLESVVFVKPLLSNPRVIRQDGAFLLFGVNGQMTMPATINDDWVVSENRLAIPRRNKSKILGQLSSLGISQATIYPEIDKVAEQLKADYSSVQP
ncbi:FRG domain-containing protein [Parahaliea mediterranea]|uniref:FRG domain-containing protein n=1 Tax=Parahaliea mediterranea TaxID=651086 RepID=UPI0013001C5C|nr:FRG domain-containing protein [Parahaliea mediterranea]